MTSERHLNAAVRQANRAVNEAIRADIDRMRFRIDKFGVHRDGYLHARIVIDNERPVYFHLRYGSWLAPGQDARLKEPEALLGTDLGRTVKYALSQAARRFHPTPQEEDTDAPEVRPGRPGRLRAEDAGRDGQAVPAAGVPAGGDHPDAD